MDELTELQKVLIEELLTWGHHGLDMSDEFVIQTVDKLVETFNRKDK